MRSPRLLTEVDDLLRPDHPHLRRGDRCFFLREYVPREGFQGGETNSLILNLKKSPDRRGLPEWPYKERAIKQVAAELRDALSPAWLARGMLFVPMPPSKVRGDPLFDDRMLRVAALLTYGAEARYAEAIRQRTSVDALHRSDERRDVVALRANFEVVRDGVDEGVERIVLIDDLLTTGAHFRAARDLLAEAFPGRPIAGVFVARRVPQGA
jgi:hypothetical protein